MIFQTYLAILFVVLENCVLRILIVILVFILCYQINAHPEKNLKVIKILRICVTIYQTKLHAARIDFEVVFLSIRWREINRFVYLKNI